MQKDKTDAMSNSAFEEVFWNTVGSSVLQSLWVLTKTDQREKLEFLQPSSYSYIGQYIMAKLG